MKITVELTVVEKNDVDVSLKDDVKIWVSSHWNRRDFVVLTVGDRRYTLYAPDLRRAVEKAEK